MSTSRMAQTPQPPYYAVILHVDSGPPAITVYAETADRMVELASKQPGFIGDRERARRPKASGSP